MSIRFGLLLDHQFPAEDNLADHLDEMIKFTERARDLGFDAIFGIHHFLASLQTPQPFQLLARLIPHSGSMLLGTSVYVSTLSHPVQIAEEIGTLDQLSRGRVVFGAGIGYRDEEFQSFGIDRTTRGPRFVESLEVIEGLLKNRPFDFTGKYFQVQQMQSSVQPFENRKIPTWIGANTPETIQRAARIGDAWIASPNVKLNWAVGNLKSFKDIKQSMGISGTNHDYPIARELLIAQSEEIAKQYCEQFLRDEYLEYSKYDLDHFVEMFEELFEKSFLIGSAPSVKTKLEKYIEGGFNFFLFRTFWSGMPYEHAIETLERFSKDIMPKFK